MQEVDTTHMRAQIIEEQKGFTLIEVLVAVALTAAVTVVIWGLLVSVAANRRVWQERIQQYSSIRTAAARFTQDARFSKNVEIGPCSSLVDPCYLDLLQAGYDRKIRYTYATYDTETKQFSRAPVGIPTTLSRYQMVVEGNSWVVKSNEVVAEGLLPPTKGNSTWFGYTASDGERKAAFLRLVTAPVPGQSCGPKLPGIKCGSELTVTAFLR